MGNYTTGPGSLVFGDPGDTNEIAAQVTSCTVKWATDSEDDIPVLSGETVEGEETHTATLSGNLLQDIKASGVSTWSWENKGLKVPFIFVPNDVEARHVTGMVKVRATDVGGEVKKKATSDFEFPCVGEPELGQRWPLMAGLRVEGGRELRATLKEAADDLTDLKAAHKEAAQLVENAAVPAAPRKTGALAGSVRSAGTANAAIIRAGGAQLRRAGPVHFGWAARHIKPQPFITEAAQRTEPRWQDIYLGAVNDILDNIKGA